METDLSVNDVMTRRHITADSTESADALARRMADAGVGCIVIVEGSRPVGIVTERDLVVKLVSKNARPSEAKAQDIMSTPLITIRPDTSVETALREMARRRIRRLPVVQGGRLVGVVSDSDLLSVSLDLSAILRDIIRQNNPDGDLGPDALDREWRQKDPSVFVQGICEVCQSFQESLENVDGTYMCARCREEFLQNP